MAVALRLTPQLVARVPRALPPAVAAASGNPLASDEDHATVLASIHNNRPATEAARGEFWVFAYGSLIWNPGFRVTDARPARAHALSPENWAAPFWKSRLRLSGRERSGER